MSSTLSHLKPEHQRLAAWALPALALLIAGLVIFFPACDLRHYDAAIAQTQAAITAKQQAIRQATKIAGGRALAVAVIPASEDEPVIFLHELTQLVAQCGGRLVSVREEPTRPSSPTTSTSRPAGQGEMMGRKIAQRSDVLEISERITLVATYRNLLLLLSRLENHRRILSLSDCRIQVASEGYPILQASFVVGRYVWTGAQNQGAPQ